STTGGNSPVAGDFDEIMLVAIEISSSVAGKMDPTQKVLADLKAAGVDANDYDAVMKHYGQE
ncbi:MAG: hypothetical protein MUO53_11720, partial [Maribacter sp.]|nr:hypothetical protein [Maribacter sp.]